MVKSTTLSATREDSTGDNLFSRYNKAFYISVLRRKNQLFSQSMVASTGQTTGSSFNGKRLFFICYGFSDANFTLGFQNVFKLSVFWFRFNFLVNFFLIVFVLFFVLVSGVKSYWV